MVKNTVQQEEGPPFNMTLRVTWDQHQSFNYLTSGRFTQLAIFCDMALC